LISIPTNKLLDDTLNIRLDPSVHHLSKIWKILEIQITAMLI